METDNSNKRRHFIKQASLASAAFFIPAQEYANQLFSNSLYKPEPLHVSLFSKQLQFLNYRNMSEAIKEMGFDGVDLTVRPKGHVLPERVADDLPLATEAMKSFGIDPVMFTSSISDAQDPIQMNVLKTASQLGYQYYRPTWYKYPKNTAILNVVKDAEIKLTQLAKVNAELNLSTSYHNHSGNYFGAPVWDLHRVISKLTTETIGVQYDIMHATVEGGKSWEATLNLIKPFINTIVVKDFVWGKVKGKWDKIYVPMGEGMVDFKKYFSILKKNNINVPVSIHVEHDLGGAEHGKTPTIPHKEVLKRIQKDLDYLRKAWDEVN